MLDFLNGGPTKIQQKQINTGFISLKSDINQVFEAMKYVSLKEDGEEDVERNREEDGEKEEEGEEGEE